MQRSLLTILALAVLSAVHPFRTSLASTEKKGAVSFALSNGLNVVLKSEPSGSLVAVELWVGAGSADEEPGEAGVAHVVEHTLFRGSPSGQGTKFAGQIESLGARLNAFTSRDQTVFHLVLPARQLNDGLKFLAQMIQLPTQGQAQLPQEIQVVLQEWKQGEDDPRSKATGSLFRLLYDDHPYGRPVLGTPETLKQISWHNVTRFYDRWYVANNMTLVIVGNFADGSVKKEIDRLFSYIPRAPVSARYRPEQTAQRGPRLAISTSSARQAHLLLGFPIPPGADPETPRLDVLGFILGNGESSRLARAVKSSQGSANSIFATASTRKGSGIFIVRAETESRKTLDALRAILGEIYRLREQLIEPSELSRAMANFRRFFVESKETVQKHARQLGRFQSRYGTPDYEESYMNAIRAVTLESLRATAGKYFKTDKLSVSLVVPEGTTLDLDRLRLEAMSYELEKMGQGTALPAQDRVMKATLENGLRIVIEENSKLPLVAIHAASIGGLVAENERNNGIHNFITSMLTQGTARLTAPRLTSEVEHLAGTMSGSTRHSVVNFSATFPDQELLQGLDLFFDALFHSSFPEESLEKTRQEIQRRIKNDEEQLRAKVTRLLYQTLFTAHPYRLPLLGRRDVVAGISRQELLDRYRELFSPDRTVLAVVGRVNGEKLLTRIKERLSSLQRHGAPLATPELEPPLKEKRGEKQRIKTLQAHVVLGFLGPTQRHEDYFPMKVTEAILSHIGGRLFHVLRDQKGLAYAVRAFVLENPLQGVFALHAATDPDKVDEITEGFLGELEKLRQREVSEDELRRAKNYVLGSFDISRQSNSAKASDLAMNELFGLGTDTHQRYHEGIERVTAEAVRSFALKYLTLDRYARAVIGP